MRENFGRLIADNPLACAAVIFSLVVFALEVGYMRGRRDEVLVTAARSAHYEAMEGLQKRG